LQELEAQRDLHFELGEKNYIYKKERRKK